MADLSFDDLPDASTPAGGQQPGDVVVRRPGAGMFDDIPAAPAPRVSREAEPTPEQLRAARIEQFKGEAERNRAEHPILGNVDMAMRSVGRGVPFMDDISAFGNTVFGGGRGNTFGERFTDNKDFERAANGVDDTNHPVASTVGQIGGGLMLPVPPIAKGATMVDQIGHGVVTGLGLGAAYGAGEGDTMDERLHNAGVGAVAGGVAGSAAPVATSLLGKGAGWLYGHTLGPVINHFRQPAAAENRIVQAVGSDAGSPLPKIGAADLPASITDGQPIAVGDLGAANTQALARSAKNTSPDADAALTSMTKGRANEQAGRYTDKIGSMFGGDLNNTGLNDRLLQRARVENDANYTAAHASPNAQSMWNGDLQDLARSPTVQASIKNVAKTAQDEAVLQGYRPIKNPFTFAEDGTMRTRATMRADGTVESATPNLAFWDAVKRDLDGKIGVAQRGGDKTEAARLIGLKNQLVTHLDNAVPEYGTARRGAAAAFGAEDALEAGQKFATGQNKAIDFTDAQKAVASMSPPERELFARGYAAELQGRANGPASRADLAGSTMFDSPAQRAKARLALGDDRADSLEAFTRREQIMNGLKNAVSGNSTTVKQLMELGLVGVGTGGFEMWHKGEMSLPAAGAALVAGGLGVAAVHGANHFNAQVTREVGQLLSSTDPATVQRILSKSQNRGELMDALRQLQTYTQAATSKTAAQLGSKSVADDGAALGEGGTTVGVAGSGPGYAGGGAVAVPGSAGQGAVQGRDPKDRKDEQAVGNEHGDGGNQAPRAQGENHRDHFVSMGPSRTTSGTTDFMRSLVSAIAERRRFAEGGYTEGGRDARAYADQIPPDLQGSISPTPVTLSDRLFNGIQGGLSYLGMEPHLASEYGRRGVDAAGYTPAGVVLGADQGLHDIDAGDYKGAALNLGMAGLGVLPGARVAEKGALKAAERAAGEDAIAGIGHNGPPDVVGYKARPKPGPLQEAHRVEILNGEPTAPGDTTLPPTGTMNPLDSEPVTFRGKTPHDFTPEEWHAFGKEHGVDNLGPASEAEWRESLVPYQTSDGKTFTVPGGVDSAEPLTYYDLLHLKSQGIDPSLMDRNTHAALQRRMAAAVTPEAGDPVAAFNGLAFGMTSPNNPLHPNQLAMTRLRARNSDDISRLADSIPWKYGDNVTAEQRKAADAAVSKMYGANAGEAGGLGVSGSAQWSRIAEMAQMYRDRPDFFMRKPGEPWDQFVEKLSSQVPGLSLKTGSFSGVWQNPLEAQISAIDRHMANKFGDKLFSSPEARSTFNDALVQRWNKGVGFTKDEQAAGKTRPQIGSFEEMAQHPGADSFVQDQLLQLVGQHSDPKAITMQGKGADRGLRSNPAVPEHLRPENANWVSQPEKVQIMSDAYRRALDENDRISQESGLHLFPSQWMEWDRIRRRLEPHENMFPGLNKLPAMNMDQLRRTRETHWANREMTYGKDTGDDGVKALVPTLPVRNPSRMGYFALPGAVGAGAAVGANDDSQPQTYRAGGLAHLR